MPTKNTAPKIDRASWLAWNQDQDERELAQAEQQEVTARVALARLEELLSEMTGEQSELARWSRLPEAKQRWEEAYPETKHGGKRVKGQVADPETCRFVSFVSKRVGLSESTIRTKLSYALRLSTLDDQARSKAYGSTLANKLGDLARIAALPAETQIEIAETWRKEPDKARSLLRRKEKEMGLPKDKPDPKKKKAPSVLSEVMRVLGVKDAKDCVAAILKLQRAANSGVKGAGNSGTPKKRPAATPKKRSR